MTTTDEAAPGHRNKDDLLALLDGLGVERRLVEHPPVHTVEEALPHWAALPGTHTKNLFLKDAKDQLWLVSAPADRAIDLKLLPRQIGSKRLSFASADLLHAVLGVRQGALSPLALVNDTGRRVRLVLDAALAAAPAVTFHPLVNTATVSIRPEGLQAFLAATGHEPLVVPLDRAPEPASA
jgi:Ala-tRNA(Pro) deacylase